MTDEPLTIMTSLTGDQRAALDALLDALIPPDAAMAMPGAGQLRLLDPTRGNQELLQAAAALAPALADNKATGADPIADLMARQPAAFQGLVMQVLVHYYRHPEVLRALGLEPGPPFPRGNVIPGGDLSLLAPVQSRAPFYRE